MKLNSSKNQLIMFIRKRKHFKKDIPPLILNNMKWNSVKKRSEMSESDI